MVTGAYGASRHCLGGDYDLCRSSLSVPGFLRVSHHLALQLCRLVVGVGLSGWDCFGRGSGYCGGQLKWLELGNSGATIAMRLGGKQVFNSTDVFEERRLVDIIEEPPINAFVAETDRRNMIITVTRNSITQLNRDQLQSVIVHEFNHIYSCDMRLNPPIGDHAPRHFGHW